MLLKCTERCWGMYRSLHVLIQSAQSFLFTPREQIWSWGWCIQSKIFKRWNSKLLFMVLRKWSGHTYQRKRRNEGEKTSNNRISFSMMSGADTFHVLFGWSRNRFFRGSDGFQHTLEANVSQGSLAVVLVDNSVWKGRWVFECKSL